MADRSDDDREEPLDPAIERVQVKLRRMILFSGLTLGLGLIAVLIAVIFRVSNMDRRDPSETWTSTLELPIGAEILATDVDGDRVAVTVNSAEGRQVLVYDMPSGRRIGSAVLLAR